MARIRKIETGAERAVHVRAEDEEPSSGRKLVISDGIAVDGEQRDGPLWRVQAAVCSDPVLQRLGEAGDIGITDERECAMANEIPQECECLNIIPNIPRNPAKIGMVIAENAQSRRGGSRSLAR